MEKVIHLLAFGGIYSLRSHPVRDVNPVENMFVRARQYAEGMQLRDIRFGCVSMKINSRERVRRTQSNSTGQGPMSRNVTGISLSPARKGNGIFLRQYPDFSHLTSEILYPKLPVIYFCLSIKQAAMILSIMEIICESALCHFGAGLRHFYVVPCHFYVVLCHFNAGLCHFDAVPCHFDAVPCHFDVVLCHFDVILCHFNAGLCHFYMVPCHCEALAKATKAKPVLPKAIPLFPAKALRMVSYCIRQLKQTAMMSDIPEHIATRSATLQIPLNDELKQAVARPQRFSKPLRSVEAQGCGAAPRHCEAATEATKAKPVSSKVISSFPAKALRMVSYCIRQLKQTAMMSDIPELIATRLVSLQMPLNDELKQAVARPLRWGVKKLINPRSILINESLFY